MGNETSSLKRVFESLDTNQSGYLTLDNMLAVPDRPGMEFFYNSLWLLFKFDKNKEGNIVYSEFEKLANYIKSVTKDAKERRNSKQRTKMWIPITRKTAGRQFVLTRDSTTPIITGRMPIEVSAYDEENSNSSEDDSEFGEFLYVETSDFFERTVRTEEGRQTFIQWLFKLTDIKGDKKLDDEELSILIKALRNDGINPEELAYYGNFKKDLKNLSSDEKDLFIAKQLISDFSFDRTESSLKKKEFRILAKLILKSYEILYDEVAIYQQDGKVRLDGYAIRRKLGKGADGVVMLAVELKTGKRKAIKVVPKGNFSDLSRLDTEIKAMMMLHHERILVLEQVLESENEVFFVMELCGGGSLYEYLDGNPLPENLARHYFTQILKGVAYCHSKGVAHRDLKLDNILLDNTANIKITDFGHAGIFKKGWDLFGTPLVGSLCHVAPEQILGHPYSGEKHDMWSLGIILYILLVGKHPFRSRIPQELLDNVTCGRMKIPDFLSEDAKDILKSLLSIDSDSRPSSREALNHPWISQGPMDAPLLTSFTIPIEKRIWASLGRHDGMCKILRKIGIEPIYDEGGESKKKRRRIKCHWIKKDLKFSFRLSKNQNALEFRLRSGNSIDFLSLMPVLKNKMGAKLSRYYPKGKVTIRSHREEEAIPFYLNDDEDNNQENEEEEEGEVLDDTEDEEYDAEEDEYLSNEDSEDNFDYSNREEYIDDDSSSGEDNDDVNYNEREEDMSEDRDRESSSFEEYGNWEEDNESDEEYEFDDEDGDELEEEEDYELDEYDEFEEKEDDIEQHYDTTNEEEDEIDEEESEELDDEEDDENDEGKKDFEINSSE